MNQDLLLLIFGSTVMVVLTVSVHALMLGGVRRRLSRRIEGKSYDHHQVRETLVISATVISLSLTHLMEIVIWAVGYTLLGAIPSFGDAFYFSITTYTTVGAIGVNIAPAFRSLAGFESLIGPMMIAWSTAFLVEFVTRMRGKPENQPR